MIGTSWLMRAASTFAHMERSLKAAPVQPGALYPAQSRPISYPLVFPGWDQIEREGQSQNDKDLKLAKTALTSPWVFSDIQAIAKEFSTAELVVKERTGTKLEDVENHPLELLWESPNEHMGRSFLTEFWTWSYVLASKAYLYWVPDTSNTSIMEVWPVPPFMLRPVPDATDFIRGYAFKSGPDATPIFIPSDLITYSHSVNLFDARDGLSFLAAAMTEIKADLAASEWNLNFFDVNNGLPDGLVGLSPEALDQDVERVRMELRDFFGGTKRGIAVARSSDLKYTEFGRSQKDMEFSQGREFASKIIGRTLGFPDGYWSDLANRANAEQARKTMISGAVWPLLVRLSEDMNARRRGIVHRWYGDNFRVEFKDIRPEDRQLFLQEQAARKDYWIINELREADGKDPLEDVRGLMLIAEINKGAPIPGTEAAQELEDQQAEKDEAAAQKQAAAIEAGLAPDPNAAPEADALPEGQPPPEEEEALPVKAYPIMFMDKNGVAVEALTPAVDLRADDLHKWEMKALKSLKRFHRADTPFESSSIPLPEQVRIHEALKAAQTAQDVRGAFKADDAVGDLIAANLAGAIDWAKEAMKGE